MGRRPNGGVMQVVAENMEEHASEIYGRTNQLAAMDVAEANAIKGLVDVHQSLGSLIARIVEHDRWENGQHASVNQLASQIIDVCGDYRQHLEQARDGELRGLMQRMLDQMSAIAVPSQRAA